MHSACGVRLKLCTTLYGRSADLALAVLGGMSTYHQGTDLESTSVAAAECY